MALDVRDRMVWVNQAAWVALCTGIDTTLRDCSCARMSARSVLGNIRNIYIMKIAPLAPRPVGRPLKQQAAKRRGISVTLDWTTLKKMQTVRQVYEKHEFPPPTDSWMVEKGLERYFKFELQRFPDLKGRFADIERPLSIVRPVPRKSTKIRGIVEDRPPRGRGRGA
jgi:hypothetical protein